MQQKIGGWFLGKTLRKGTSTWIQKGYDIKTSKAVALKFIDKKYINDKELLLFKTEIEALKQIKHKNIARLLDYNLNGKYPTHDNEESDVIVLALEYISGGELFDILYYTSKLGEIIARTYFKQLIAALEALHNASIIHRDIKPENLLLDKHFTLKLCHFGFAKFDKSNNDEITQTYYGYEAPEVLLQQEYTSNCDIFSSGVVLFTLLCGYPPFKVAKISDRWYSNIAKKKYKSFWKSHRGCGISPGAMDLITRMLHYTPEKRISLSQIKQHNWYLGKTLSQHELTKLLKLKHTQMQLKRQIDPVKQDILSYRKKIGLSQQIRENNDSWPKPAPELPLDESIGLLDVFSEKYGYEILDNFNSIAKYSKGLTEVDFSNFQLTIKMAVESSDSKTKINEIIDLLICVYHYTSYNCNVVKFHRVSGDLIPFRQCLNFLQRECNSVLTGVPIKVMESLHLTESETIFVNRYYSSDFETLISEDENKTNLNLGSICINILISFLVTKLNVIDIFPKDVISIIVKYVYNPKKQVDIPKKLYKLSKHSLSA